MATMPLAAGAPPAFDPATLALTGWWRGSFAASPWVGTASAGSSSTNDATEATNPPAVGSDLNGYDSADFDGTNDLLSADGTMADYINATAYSAWALVYIDAIATDSGTIYQNDPPMADSGAYWGAYLQSTGPMVVVYHNGLTIEGTATVSITTGAWALIQWKYDGTDLSVRVNSGAWDSMAVDELRAAGLTTTLQHGHNYNVAWFNGRAVDLGVADTAFSDGTFDDIKDYVNDRYGLAL